MSKTSSRPRRSGRAVALRQATAAGAAEGSAGRIALGVSGGIAAYKSAEIVRALKRLGFDVHVLMTENAQRFIAPLTLQTLSGHHVLSDPWDLTHGADIQHIALARGLDAFVIAPATADVLAKLAHGLADDAVSTFHLAVTAPVVVAPAMNVWMWEHPATRDNIATLRRRGVQVVEPGTGELACGEEGIGRMAEPLEIVEHLTARLKKKVRPRLRVAGSS